MLERNKLILLFILSLLNPYICQVQLQSDCTTPSGDDGTCISIMDCQPLLSLVQKNNRTTEELQMLRQSQCGFDGKIVKVCCANKDDRCYNPDGNLGVCVSVHSCPSVKKLLEPPISTEDLDFLKNSKCESSVQYSVCCGPDHDTDVTSKDICEPTIAPPDPRTECCGLDGSTGNKIIGGTAVAIDQYPWIALIEYRSEKDNKIKLLCGGALISSRYVLTAAHCTVGPVLDVGKPENVRFGEYDTSNSGPDCVATSGDGVDCTDGIVILPIQKVIPHRGYDPKSHLRRNDIALIRVASNVPYNEFIRPICLPTSDVTQTKQNLVLHAAGWGAVSASQSFSNIKLHIDLPFKQLEQCQTAYNVSSRRLRLWQGQMCAGGESGKDTCRGDSGGPLMYDNGRIYTAVGVVSFGPTPCALKDVPAVYTKVYEYIPWIRSNIKP